MPAAVAMIQTCMDVRYKGVAIGIFLFCTTISGTVAVTVDASLIKSLGAEKDPKKIGQIVALSTIVPTILAAIAFYFAGIHYAA